MSYPAQAEGIIHTPSDLQNGNLTIRCSLVSYSKHHIYWTHKWDSTTPGQSGPGSNDNKRILHTPQISRRGASTSDTVQCHTQATLFLGSLMPLHSIHHYVTLSAQTLSCHTFLSSIAFGRSSGLHTVSAQSCCM